MTEISCENSIYKLATSTLLKELLSGAVVSLFSYYQEMLSVVVLLTLVLTTVLVSLLCIC